MRRRQGSKVEAGFRYWMESQGLAKQTVRNYASNAGMFLAWCLENEIDFAEAEREDVQVWLGELLKTRKPSTVELKRLSVRVFYNYLIAERGYDKPSPVPKLPVRQHPPEPSEPFTKDDLMRMFVACQTHQERAVLMLLAGAGLRRAEVYGIKRSDVNEEQRTIRVLGKGSSVRYVAPGEPVIKAVVQAMEFSDRLCPQSGIDCVWRIVRRLARRAGLRGRVHPHRFRHSYATMFLDQGGSVEELMHVLGHVRIEQSLAYARAGAKQRAVVRMEKVNIAGLMLGTMVELEGAAQR